MSQKQDANLFRRRLTSLQQAKQWGARQWWPQYLYHFADLSNVVSILTRGSLYSRAAVAEQSEGFSDSASPDIIDQTEEKWKHYVRFYLRPRTPTLYRNEGFRPVNRRVLGGAHCAAPVYMLFDFAEVIAREDAAFSYGSLARPGTLIYSTAAEFAELPFDLVYHDSRFEKEERDRIVFHRHAEVIVPDQIDLGSLRWLWCRSEAEYETLRFLLPETVLRQWHTRIGVRTDYNLFNREWVYVDRVTLAPEQAIFGFNPARHSLDAGPFALQVRAVDTANGNTYTYDDPAAEINTPLVVDLSIMGQPLAYTMQLLLDGKVAYAGEYRADSLPF